ncbi:MAG: hypothetical protein ACLFR6_05535, partial [Salinarchaeum sp.]
MPIYAVKTTASQEQTVADMIINREEESIHAALAPDSLTSYVMVESASGAVFDRILDEIPPARDVVRRYVRSDRLPRPVIEVPPGHGLTGMPAYLVTGHSLSHELASITVDLGAQQASLSWTATGRSEVDWGDGTV